MNENQADNIFSSYNACRICLNTTKHLSPMSDEHIKLYINLVDEMVTKGCNMKICMICKWMLQKFAKFKRQCLTANHLLDEVTYMDFKSFPSQHSNLTISHHLTQTRPILHYYIPSFDHSLNDTHNNSQYTVQSSKNTDDNHSNSDQYFIDAYNDDYSTENDKYLNDNEYTLQNIKYTNDNEYTMNNEKYTDDNKYTANNEKYTDENKYTANNDKYTDENNDEDEVPLVKLVQNKGKNKKSKKKKKEVPDANSLITQDAVKQETEVVDKAQNIKSKRNKKILRDGFSSRMVQETNEYVVIKLTKEQVLDEMAERANTDAYISSPYKCDKCVKGFNFQDVLDTHMEKHSAKIGAFSCDMCWQYCPSAVSLRGHIKSHTTRYKCKVCGEVRASRQHLMEHHATHSGAAPLYRCLHCAFTTSKRTVMQRHARGHAAREPHACHQCGKLFKTIDYLRLHTARHDKSSRFKCQLCPDTFVYHSLLRKHVRCVHERKDFYCVECDVQFKCAESLRVHFKKAKRHRDSSSIQHPCEECGACFHTAGALATHRSLAHDAARQHACALCPRSYTTRDAVRAHTWRVHARGDTRVSCPHCGTNFARASVLKAHLRAQRGACGTQRARAVLDDTQDKRENEEMSVEV